jgi:MFS family permease
MRNKKIFFAFIWHGLFLSLTMSMLDLNTVFPSLIDEMTHSKFIFGILYSIMLGVPLVFNIIFSHYLKKYKRKKKFLLFGIYLRSFSFLGMAVFTTLFAIHRPILTAGSFFVWIFLFSISAGFAGISYADIIAKTMSSVERNKLYATKQFVGSLATFLGAFLIKQIFSMPSLVYPYQYGISLFIGAIGLFVASFGILTIKEPDSKIRTDSVESLKDFLKTIPGIIKNDERFKRFIIVENLASFSIMILPFYIIFAKEVFKLDTSYIGVFLIAQVAGTVLSNFLWGFLATKSNAKSVVKLCVFMGGMLPIFAILLSFTSPFVYTIIFVFLGFIISGRRIGFEPYLLDIAPENQRTEYLGIRGTMNIFVVVLPIIGGIFIDVIGFYITFSMVSIFMTIAYFFLRGTNPKSKTKV